MLHTHKTDIPFPLIQFLSIKQAHVVIFKADESLASHCYFIMSLLTTLFKDGSWNCMISVHPSRQILAYFMIWPYCFMGEGSIHVEYQN